MLIKKYKTLKFTSALLKLDDIAKNSCFFCLIQTKHLTHNEWIGLKQFILPFSLNIFICKNHFLKSKLFPLSLPQGILDNLNHGNLVILYSINKLVPSLTSSFFLEDFLLRKIKASPLIFYFLDRFFYPEKYLKLLKVSKQEALYKLIQMLRYSTCIVLNKMNFTSKLFLFNLSRRQI